MNTTILLIVIVLLLLGLSILVFTIGQKRNWNWKYRTFSLFPIIVVLIAAYFHFRTPDSFFKEEYFVITGTEFPKSGKIQYSIASSMAFNGDYTSAFIAELKKEDLRSLNAIVKEPQFDKVFNTFPKELEYLESKFGTKKYIKQFICETDNNETHMIGFLNDQKTVVIVRIVL